MIVLDNIIFELQKAGGVSAVWRAVIDAVLSDGALNVQFIDNGLSADNLFYPKTLLKNNAHIVEKGSLLRRRYKSAKVPSECKVFHSSYFRTSQQKHVKNIVTVHDFVYEKYDQGLRKQIHLWQKRKALKEAEVIICVSENTRQDLLTFHPEIARESVKVVHNGVGKEFYPLNVSNPDAPYLIYVGGRNPYKNFPLALNILRFPVAEKIGLRLKCIGGGGFSDQEKDIISDLGLIDRVEQYSGLSVERLNELYNKAFALIYPSYYEGFGIPPLEAMAAGCPVMASNAASIPEVVGDAALLFSPDDVDICESHITHLMNQSNYEKLRLQGFERAQKFTWQHTGEKTVQIYKGLM